MFVDVSAVQDAGALDTRNVVLSVCELTGIGDERPAPRICGQLATVGNRAYLFGGFDDRQLSSNLFVLEIETSAWHKCDGSDTGPPALFGHSLVYGGGILWLFGGASVADDGRNPAITPLDHLWAYHVNEGRWRHVPHSLGVDPSARMFHGCCVCEVSWGTMMVVYGGRDAQQALGDMYVFDVASEIWHPVEQSGVELPESYGHTLTFSPTLNRIVLVGGGCDDKSDCPLYTAELNKNETGYVVTWAKLPSRSHPPPNRRFHSAVLLRNNWLFMLGGLNRGSQGGAHVYDFAKERWIRPLVSASLNIWGHAADQLADKLLLFGGARPDTPHPPPLGCEFAAMRLGDVRDVLLSKENNHRLNRKLMFCTALELKGSPERSPHKFKVITVGDSGVGKTCLMRRFVSDTYHDLHLATIGADFSRMVTLVQGRLCTLELWDTAGQERFAQLNGSYFRDADGFAVVFDLTRRESFEHVYQWIETIREFRDISQGAAIALIGNKSDLSDQRVKEKEVHKLANELGAAYVFTSAKTAANVDSAFMGLATVLLANRQKATKRHNGSSVDSANAIRLDDSAGESSLENGVCGYLQSCLKNLELAR